MTRHISVPSTVFRRRAVAACRLSLRRSLRQASALTAGLLAGWLLFTPPAQALTVFDPSNYAQNLLQAARALTQIENQLRSLEHLAREQQPLAAPQLNLAQRFANLQALIHDAQGLSFALQETEAGLAALYAPQALGDLPSGALDAQARQRWLQSLQSLQLSLRLQSQVAGHWPAEEAALDTLLARSQHAVGNLQAGQVSHELLALLGRQQQQMQSLMATHYRAEALRQAGASMNQAAAERQFRSFIGAPPGAPGDVWRRRGLAD